MKPAVLLVSRLPDSLVGRLRERFDCHLLAELDDAALAALAPRLRGMVATGESVVARELIDRLPALEVISVLGVGYDGIDMAAARERKVVVAHTPGLSTDDIADFAMALLLSAARQVGSADRFVRSGGWTTLTTGCTSPPGGTGSSGTGSPEPSPFTMKSSILFAIASANLRVSQSSNADTACWARSAPMRIKAFML